MIQINKKRKEIDNDISTPITAKKNSQNFQETNFLNLFCVCAKMIINVLGPMLENKHLNSLIRSNKTIHSKFSTYTKKRKYIYLCGMMLRSDRSVIRMKELPFLPESTFSRLFIQFGIMDEGVFSEDICNSYIDLKMSSSGTQKNFLHFLAQTDCSINFLKFFLDIFSRFGLIDSTCGPVDTAFHELVRGDYCNVGRINSFLEAGADPFSRDTFGMTVMHDLFAVNRKPGFGPCLRECLTRFSLLPGFDCNDKTKRDLTFFLLYVKSTIVERDTLKMLIELGADYLHKNAYGENALFSISRRGLDMKERVVVDREVVEYLIDLKLDLNCVNRYESTPLDYFCRDHKLIPEDLEILRLFLDKGAVGKNILHSIVMSQDFEGDINETPLTTSEFIQELVVKRGVCCDVLNGKSETPLFSLCENGDFKTKSALSALRELLKLGASPKKQNEKGKTALYALCGNPTRTVESVSMLLGFDGLVDICDRGGRNVLHSLCSDFANPQSEILELLNSSSDGRLCNMGDSKGNTALHLLSSGERMFGETIAVLLGFIEKLISMGADIELENNEGKKPRDLLGRHPYAKRLSVILSKKK